MKYLSYPLLLLLLVLTILEFIPIVKWGYTHVATYQWILYGVGGYIVARQILFKNNEKWMQTFAHELSHTIVGLMFFRKIHSFYAEEGSGVITHSGRRRFGDVYISLAPYCLPYFTYVFLLLRIVGASNMLYVFDVFIGFTLAFHVSCFLSQTRSYQTDIQKHGYLRSYLFIAAMLIFNLSVILLSVRCGIVDAVVSLFSQYWGDLQDFWGTISSITSLIKK